MLKLTVPTESIDVHVHPMKMEVKFQDENLIYTIVSSAIKKALAVHHIIPSIDFDTNVNADPMAFSSRPATKPPGVTQEERDYAQFKSNIHQEIDPELGEEIVRQSQGPSAQGALLKINSDANYVSKKGADAERILDKDHERFFNLHNTYILALVRSGMLVVNLKAAYERIFYERYCKYLVQKPAVQKLLFPTEVRVSATDFALVETCKDHIEKLGFRIEMKAPGMITFTAQPPEADGKDLQQLLEELLEEYKSTHVLDANKSGEAWATSLARRMSSYQKKKTFAPDQVRTFVDQLFACDNPTIRQVV